MDGQNKKAGEINIQYIQFCNWNVSVFIPEDTWLNPFLDFSGPTDTHKYLQLLAIYSLFLFSWHKCIQQTLLAKIPWIRLIKRLWLVYVLSRTFYCWNHKLFKNYHGHVIVAFLHCHFLLKSSTLIHSLIAKWNHWGLAQLIKKKVVLKLKHAVEAINQTRVS